MTENQEYEKRESLIDAIRDAQEKIAEGAATLRFVVDETDDTYRGSTLVANLEMVVGAGGWSGLKEETLDGWIEELEEGVEAWQ